MTRNSWRISVIVMLSMALAVALPAVGPLISIEHDGTNAVVHFSGRLQTSQNVEGPYSNVLSATSPHVWAASNAAAGFWRSRIIGAATFAAGAEHSLAIKADGTLWAWGLNDYGQLGIGTYLRTNVPAQIGIESNWAMVTCGRSYSLALKTDGSLWAWGRNDYGQLGNGTMETTNLPVHILPGSHWQAIAAGFNHTVAIAINGGLWAWGRPGLGPMRNTNQPAEVSINGDWVNVACGELHTIACAANGTLWAWGRNNSGQLGLGSDESEVNMPTQVGTNSDWRLAVCGAYHTTAIRVDGTLWAWGAAGEGRLGIGNSGNTNRPVRIPGDLRWDSATAGYGHVAGLSRDGYVFAWGSNRSGQAGLPLSITGTNRPSAVTMERDWQAVAAGGFQDAFGRDFGHCLALKADGSLWAWGRNNAGQFGNGTFMSTNQTVQVFSGSPWRY